MEYAMSNIASSANTASLHAEPFQTSPHHAESFQAESFKEMLRDKNLKSTPQRIAILHQIQKSGHISVEDIYSHIKKLHPSISLATVYKNVATLSEADILREVKAPTQKQKYELASDKHIHVSCEKCGKLQDVHVDVGELLGSVMYKTGYELSDVSAVFIGVCAECAKAQAKNRQ